MISTTTRRAFPKVLIASGAPFYRRGDRVWLPPIEWKSLKQWWEFLDEVVLIKPEIESPDTPDGWLEVPPEIAVQSICRYGDARFARRRATFRAANELLRSSDVLLARMPYYETTWCYRVGKKRGMRYVLEIHGDWETAVLEEDSHSLIRIATRRFRANANRRIVEEMAANATCVLGVGPRLLEKYVPRSVPSLASTNHLLDKQDYRVREDFTLKDPPRLLFVGDMQRRKGLHILFRALSSLKTAGRRFEMIMVGTGPMVEELSDYAARQGFADNVRFAGKVAHGEELYDFFRESDIFVLPSVAAEGVPRVTHEAMAFGCPVIATDIGSVAWQLYDDAGIVVPPGDAESLARAIAEVIDKIDLRRSLSEKGFRRSLEYTFEKQKATISQFVGTHILKI